MGKPEIQVPREVVEGLLAIITGYEDRCLKANETPWTHAYGEAMDKARAALASIAAKGEGVVRGWKIVTSLGETVYYRERMVPTLEYYGTGQWWESNCAEGADGLERAWPSATVTAIPPSELPT